LPDAESTGISWQQQQNRYMRQKQISDEQNTVWTCVQALAGVEGKTADKAEKLMEANGGKVDVVCTPSGGSQSLRLKLPVNWNEQLSDEDLLKAIEENKSGSGKRSGKSIK
jgi:hypothetical protein